MRKTTKLLKDLGIKIEIKVHTSDLYKNIYIAESTIFAKDTKLITLTDIDFSKESVEEKAERTILNYVYSYSNIKSNCFLTNLYPDDSYIIHKNHITGASPSNNVIVDSLYKNMEIPFAQETNEEIIDLIKNSPFYKYSFVLKSIKDKQEIYIPLTFFKPLSSYGLLHTNIAESKEVALSNSLEQIIEQNLSNLINTGYIVVGNLDDSVIQKNTNIYDIYKQFSDNEKYKCIVKNFSSVFGFPAFVTLIIDNTTKKYSYGIGVSNSEKEALERSFLTLFNNKCEINATIPLILRYNRRSSVQQTFKASLYYRLLNDNKIDNNTLNTDIEKLTLYKKYIEENFLDIYYNSIELKNGFYCSELFISNIDNNVLDPKKFIDNAIMDYFMYYMSRLSLNIIEGEKYITKINNILYKDILLQNISNIENDNILDMLYNFKFNNEVLLFAFVVAFINNQIGVAMQLLKTFITKESTKPSEESRHPNLSLYQELDILFDYIYLYQNDYEKTIKLIKNYATDNEIETINSFIHSPVNLIAQVINKDFFTSNEVILKHIVLNNFYNN